MVVRFNLYNVLKAFPLGEGFGRAYHFNKVLRLSQFFFQESLL